MPMLSAAQITKMGALQNLGMPGTAVIQRKTLGGAYGSPEGAWAAVGTATCRMGALQPKPNRESVTGGQVAAVVEYVFTMPLGTDVLASDRILYSDRLYEVNSTNNDSTRKTAIRAIVTNVDSR